MELQAFLDCADIPSETAGMLAKAKSIVDSDAVDKAVDQLAVRISVALQDNNPIVLTVLHGGLVLAGMLSRRLAFPCEFGYLHATRYGNATSGDELEWRGCEHPSLAGRTVLVVDDILDEGKTLTALLEYCREQGAKHVLSAVLVSRDGLTRDIEADFAGLRLGPGFLVGCGMDVAGYGRNLTSIYRLEGV